MKPIVIYSSRSGNTQKIADAIVAELRCESKKVTKESANDQIDLNKYDLIFIGTGIHYGNPNEDLMAFLKNCTLSSPKKIAFFVTWGGAGKTNQNIVAKLKAVLETKGQKIIEDCFFCYGGWNFLKRGHPKAEEVKAALAWAKKTAQI